MLPYQCMWWIITGHGEISHLPHEGARQQQRPGDTKTNIYLCISFAGTSYPHISCSNWMCATHYHYHCHHHYHHQHHHHHHQQQKQHQTSLIIVVHWFILMKHVPICHMFFGFKWAVLLLMVRLHLVLRKLLKFIWSNILHTPLYCLIYTSHYYIHCYWEPEMYICMPR